MTTLLYNNDSELFALLSAAMSGDMEARRTYIQQELLQSGGSLSGIAMSWLTEMANSGDPFARHTYIEMALRGAIPNCDWLRLEIWIGDILKEDEAAGCFLMSNLYNPALPGLADWNICEQYLRRGVDAGSAGCCVMLASVYREVLQDKAGAAEIRSLLEKALKTENDAEIYLLLAEVCLDMGDTDSAIRSLNKCRKEHPQFPESWTMLGDMYQDGLGVRQNSELALKHYYKAAEQGSSHALLKLGMMYYYGRGCRLNYKRAVGYFHQAAEAGETEAYHFLAVCYRYGDGVAEDRKEMLRWVKKGVEIDDPYCCMLLAGLYMLGDGVETDFVRSAELLRIAREKAPQGDESFLESLDTMKRELASISSRAEPEEFEHEGIETEGLEPEETVIAQLKELRDNGDKNGVEKMMLHIVDNYPITPLIRKEMWEVLEMKAASPECIADMLVTLRDMAPLFPDVSLLLGDMYYFGVGVRKNAASALKFYRMTETDLAGPDDEECEADALQPDVCARLILGIHEKVLKPKDSGINYWIDKTQMLLHESGRLNFLMGLLHYFGLHVEKDEKKAGLLFRQAGILGFSADWKKAVEAYQSGRISLYAAVYPEMFENKSH